MSVDLDTDAWATERAATAVTVDDDAPPPLRFPTLPEFMGWFSNWYRRETLGSSVSWCSEWWNHPEAIIRLEAVWRAYEALRHEPGTGVSVWIRDHVDPHLGKLMGEGSPFGTCTPTEHRDPLPPLPVADPPEDWWTNADSGV